MEIVGLPLTKCFSVTLHETLFHDTVVVLWLGIVYGNGIYQEFKVDHLWEKIHAKGARTMGQAKQDHLQIFPLYMP